MKSALLNRYYFEIGIDEFSLPPGMDNAVHSIEVIENAALLTPQVRIVINDSNNVLRGEMNLSEDNKIGVVMAVNEVDNAKVNYFRMFNERGGVVTEGHSFTIHGLLDAPKFTKGIETKAYEGTSGSVLQQVLSQCGIRVETLGTDDDQVWINPGLTRNRFVQQVIDHSYVSVSAFPRLGLEADKRGRVIDVMRQLNNPTSILTYGDTEKLGGDYSISTIAQSDDGGLLGSWTGYGYDLYDPRLDGKLMKSDGVRLQTDGGYAPLNVQTYNDIKAARKDYAPQDCGNVHARYWQAYHANMRKAALFTQGLRVVVNATTDIRLFDCVEVRFAEMHMRNIQRDDPMNKTRGGNYVVTAKKRMIKGAQYAEMFLLKRVAVNNQGKTELLSQDGRGSPTPTEVDQGEGGKSKWTYVTENRLADPKDHCFDIVDEEVMPTPNDSTDWDDVVDWTDENPLEHGPYERAHTGKHGVVLHRARDTDPPQR